MNQIPNIEETNTREIEETLSNIEDIIQNYHGNWPDEDEMGEILGELRKLEDRLHHQLQKAREEERERIANGLDELMEKLADIEHVRWAKWQNYLHSHLTWNNEIQAWVLPHECKDRWQMQINKPYSMLSEKEKESDREQVRPYLELIKRKVRHHSELDQDKQ